MRARAHKGDGVAGLDVLEVLDVELLEVLEHLLVVLRQHLRQRGVAQKLRERHAASYPQARFTGGIVVALPLAGAALAELASPGYLRSLGGSFLTAWLGGLAIVMQVVAAVLIRRLGRVRA